MDALTVLETEMKKMAAGVAYSEDRISTAADAASAVAAYIDFENNGD